MENHLNKAIAILWKIREEHPLGEIIFDEVQDNQPLLYTYIEDVVRRTIDENEG